MTSLAAGVAALSLLLLAAAGPSYRLGLLSMPIAFALLQWAAYTGIAAMVVARDRPAWWRWLVPVTLAGLTLLGFHWYMDTYAGWGISRNAASNFSSGSWLAIWWKNNPSIAHKALMIFAPFGFAWLFAAIGYRHAGTAIRQLALGAALPILLLVYVQTPERALGNAFFVIIPLATAFLGQVPTLAAWAAAITSGLVTARMGLSTELLPSSSILLVPATMAAAWAVAAYSRKTG